MSKYERVQTAIPIDNPWKLEDIDNRADELGMSRTDFILKAIDFFINIDLLTYKKMEVFTKTDNFTIPMYMYVQNKIIKDMAQTQAALESGRKDLIVNEFIMLNDSEGLRLLTGIELQNQLKEQYLQSINF